MLSFFGFSKSYHSVEEFSGTKKLQKCQKRRNCDEKCPKAKLREVSGRRFKMLKVSGNLVSGACLFHLTVFDQTNLETPHRSIGFHKQMISFFGIPKSDFHELGLTIVTF